MGVVASWKVSTYLHILMDDAVSERVIDDGLHGSVAGVTAMLFQPLFHITSPYASVFPWKVLEEIAGVA